MCVCVLLRRRRRRRREKTHFFGLLKKKSRHKGVWVSIQLKGEVEGGEGSMTLNRKESSTTIIIAFSFFFVHPSSCVCHVSVCVCDNNVLSHLLHRCWGRALMVSRYYYTSGFISGGDASPACTAAREEGSWWADTPPWCAAAAACIWWCAAAARWGCRCGA